MEHQDPENTEKRKEKIKNTKKKSLKTFLNFNKKTLWPLFMDGVQLP